MGLHSYLYFSILIFTSPLLSLLLHSYLYSSTLISTSPLLSLLLHSYLYFSTLIFTNFARKSTWIQDPRIPLFCDYAPQLGQIPKFFQKFDLKAPLMVIKGWDGLNLSLMDEEHDR